MGKLLEVFKDNTDVIIRRLSENLHKIVKLLQENGVYKEEETHDLLKHQPYLVVKKMFSHVDAGGYYAEFIDALTNAKEYSVAEFVKGKLIFMCMFCRSLFVLLYFFFWPLRCLFFFDIQIL